MEMAIAKMSSKGQIVIPSDMRENMKEGDQILIMKGEHQLILKNTDELGKQLKEDLEFARRTEEAYKEIERGECVTISSEDFLKNANKKSK